ncbi:hypothetical protein V6Z11_A11G320300 [Gossypium hirsutum]
MNCGIQDDMMEIILALLLQSLLSFLPAFRFCLV